VRTSTGSPNSIALCDEGIRNVGVNWASPNQNNEALVIQALEETNIVSLKHSDLLADKITALRRRHVSVAATGGLAVLVLVSVELLALAMFLDWWLELPWGLRVISLLAQAAVFAWMLIRMVLAPMLRQPDEDELALMIEKAHPEFRSRLIASMQLVRPGAIPAGASTTLVSALVAETETLARPNDFRRIVATDRLKKFGALAVLVPLLALAGFSQGGETCIELLKRAFLSNVPVPRKTRIEVPDGNRTIGIGDTTRLEAFVSGIIPARGKVDVHYRSRRAQEFSLEQNRDNARNFARTLENVQDGFTYQFSLGDGISPTFEIRAIPRPTVATIECEQVYPAYTGLKTARRNLGDLSLLAGSRLRLQAVATKDIKTSSIHLVGVNQEMPLTVAGEPSRELNGEFTVPAKGLTGFQIQMLDTEGLESRDSAIYRVDVVPDKVPLARITYPDRKEELITRHATMLVAFEASDDFEIARVRLKYKVDAIDQGAEQAIDLDLEDLHPQRLRRRYEWKIGAFTPLLSEGSVIEYWLEVQDNNNVTGPGIGSSDHQLAKVVSEAEKRADLLNRAGDYLGSIGDVAADQERLNKNLGLIIRAKAGMR
jgi:hypothetical protein